MFSVFSLSRLQPQSFLICFAALGALAIAMGIGRFAFTPLFPLMVREGLIDHEIGSVLAVANYAGYFIGALIAGRLPIRPPALILLGVSGTIVVTGAMSLPWGFLWWIVLRCLAGILSAWVMVGTSAWSLAWLEAIKRPALAGTVYAGVGIGIVCCGLFCLFAVTWSFSALEQWLGLSLLAVGSGLLSGIVIIRAQMPIAPSRPLSTSSSLPAGITRALDRTSKNTASPNKIKGLLACYVIFGYSYIMPATYLPELARQLIDDPAIFGWIWPLFGLSAACSTLFIVPLSIKWGRLRVWAISYCVLSLGVIVPVIMPSLGSIAFSALCVGGTFMVITMVALQEARAQNPTNPARILGFMTASFGLGQMSGPLILVGFSRIADDATIAMFSASSAAAVGLLVSAIWIWLQKR